MRQDKDILFLFVYAEDEEVTMKHSQLTATLTVAEVMDRWPQTVPIFLRHQMACIIGCSIRPFETVPEVAEIYGLELEHFMRGLQQIIS